MIDYESRKQFANLIVRFSDGELTSSQFFNSSIRFNSIESQDLAIRSIDVMLWHSYSEESNKAIILNAQAQRALQRWLLFLRSDLEYEWPDDKGIFFATTDLGWVLRVCSLGLTTLLEKWLRKRSKKFMSSYQSYGDIEVWPFVRRSDFEKQLEKQ